MIRKGKRRELATVSIRAGHLLRRGAAYIYIYIATELYIDDPEGEAA